MYLRRLNPADPRDLQLGIRLFAATPAYALATFGVLPTASAGHEILTAFPPECEPQDRLVFAALDKDTPVGLVRVLRRYPSLEVCTIGLLLVDAALQRRGHGSEIVNRLSRQARNWAGAQRWGLNVLDCNEGGLAFWRHNGFQAVQTRLRHAAFASTVTVMERAIKHKPPCGQKVPADRARDTGDAPWLSAGLLGR